MNKSLTNKDELTQSNNLLNQTIYNPTTDLSLNQKFWWQTFGMFLFFSLICNIKIEYGFDFWITAILLVAILLSVKQSGAHYNPSMTLSNFLIKFSPTKIDPVFMWTYFKSQFIGAFLAYNYGYYMRGYYYPPYVPPTGLDGFRIILSQIMGTFILVVMLQKIANSQTTFTTNDGQTYCFVVMFVYVARRFAILSGNNINPVGAFAGACAAILQCNFQSFKYFYLYLIGDIIGPILGAWFFNNLLEPALRISRKQTNLQRKLSTDREQSLSKVIKDIQYNNNEDQIDLNKLTRIQHVSQLLSQDQFNFHLLSPPTKFRQQQIQLK